ncbi:glycosyltransferase [Leuconostoc mesenteroides]|uniref:glycosyltransferase n=1 Tax=Leuconostoc mesenteroides TaxID=1245 RepID=UPI00235E5FEB|nr:glycosyltransferase [Leuconostoc mesenteroides]
MVKVASLIITYNPNIDKLKELINTIEEQFERCLIVDNGSKNIASLTNTVDNQRIISLNENTGIAHALNVGIDRLMKEGYEWVITFDQDSQPESNLNEVFQKLSITKEDAVIGTYYIDNNWSPEERQNNVSSFKVYDETFYVITSGCFLNTTAWLEVKGFDDSLFIDWVDFDYNKRLILRGYRVYRTNKLIMKHEVGEVIQRPKLLKQALGLNRPIRDHSATRQYYIFRNRIIFYKRYANDNMVKSLIRSLIAIREVILLPKPQKKIHASIKGIIDGLKYRVKNDEFFKKYVAK